MLRFLSGLVLLLAFCARPLQAVTPYQYGMLPTVAADADMTSAYNTWKSRYFKTITCGSPMAWVDRGDGNAVSEGVAYGMLMTAYLDASSTDFAKLYAFYVQKKDGHNLMNWLVPGNCNGDNGANAATDADLDVAIALIRAHRRWPAEGWGAKASTVLNNIYSNMVDGCQGLKNGDSWGGCSSGANNAYNPSYFRTAYFNSYNCFEGGNRWTAVRNQSYSILNKAYSSYALPPDWVRNDGSWGQATNSGGYGYDSCRTPWSMTQDYLWWGNVTGQNWGKKIGLAFGNKSGGWGNPASAASDVGDDYNYSSGAKVRGNHENAFIGGAAVAFMAGTATAQLNAFYNELKFNDNNSYYSDSLKVIYLMILTGTFQEPCYGPGPIPTATPSVTATPYAGTPTQTPMPAFGLVFEDFENGITGNYAYTGPTQSRQASAAHAGAYGYEVDGTLAGGGVGFNSSYANGQGVVDATGAVALRFWVKSNVNISFQVDWYEAGATGAPVAGGDGEAWVTPNQNISGDATWHQVVVPMSSMIEEIYNGACNPTYASPGPCGTTGNNTMNLSAVNKIQIKFTLGTAAAVQFDDFEFVLGTQPTPTVTRTPFIGSYNQVFDDMESPLSLNQSVIPAMAGSYADTANGASASVTKTTAVLAPGGGGNTTSGQLTYNTGNASSYGAGAYLLSPYSGPSLYADVSGAVFLGFWINAPAGLAYRVEFTEAGTPTSPTAGAEGEAWQSSLQVASGGWEFVQLEVGSFSEDIYNPICTPNCAANGDGIKDFQAISSVTLKLDGNQGSGTVYFDDVVFVTSFKSPTPTQSPSFSPSFSRTPTQAGSPTPTRTPSATPTNSPVPTDTPTPSPSPSESPYVGTSTFTAVDTPSFTATFTPTPSPTATQTQTPQPGSPTYTVVPPTSTFTFTVTVPTATFTSGPSLTNTPVYSATRTQTPAAAPTSTDTPTTVPGSLPVLGGASPGTVSSAGGDVLTVTGSNFAPGAEILFDGTALTATWNNAGSLSVTLPAHAPATVLVQVRNPGNQLSAATQSVVISGPAATFTATPLTTGGGSDSQPILQTRPFPNPMSGGYGSVRVQLGLPVEGLSLKVYSSAMIMVGQVQLGALPAGWVEIGLPSSALGQASGTYYYVAMATRNGTTMKGPKSGRLVLLH